MAPESPRQTPSQEKQDIKGKAVGRCTARARGGWREGKHEQLVIRRHSLGICTDEYAQSVCGQQDWCGF